MSTILLPQYKWGSVADVGAADATLLLDKALDQRRGSSVVSSGVPEVEIWQRWYLKHCAYGC